MGNVFFSVRLPPEWWVSWVWWDRATKVSFHSLSCLRRVTYQVPILQRQSRQYMMWRAVMRVSEMILWKYHSPRKLRHASLLLLLKVSVSTIFLYSRLSSVSAASTKVWFILMSTHFVFMLWRTFAAKVTVSPSWAWQWGYAVNEKSHKWKSGIAFSANFSSCLIDAV